jgi:two-component system, chemotaxis family, response regulator PixG
MTATYLKLMELAETLDTLCKKRATGEIVLKNSLGEGKLHLLSGRLLFANNGIHPVRRWQRAIKQNCPNWYPDYSKIVNENLWEYQLLYQGILQKELSVTQGKAVIRSIAQEIFFDLGFCSDCTLNWVEGSSAQTELALSLSVSYLEFEPDLLNAAQLQKKWRLAGLSKLSPNLAPVVKQALDPYLFASLEQDLQGQLNLWDLSLNLEKSIYEVALMLLPLVKQHFLKFRIIADLPLPIQQKELEDLEPLELEVVATQTSQQKLIACIDDSPLIGEMLQKILEPLGYDILYVQEPMRGFAQILEHKPDLIFLDLIMPNANGYTVCKFLRKTSIFAKTPIIILSSRDNLIDRNRAKLVGASDFLGKPPDPQKTLQIIQKHLHPNKENVVKYHHFSKEKLGLAF